MQNGSPQGSRTRAAGARGQEPYGQAPHGPQRRRARVVRRYVGDLLAQCSRHALQSECSQNASTLQAHRGCNRTNRTEPNRFHNKNARVFLSAGAPGHGLLTLPQFFAEALSAGAPGHGGNFTEVHAQGWKLRNWCEHLRDYARSCERLREGARCSARPALNVSRCSGRGRHVARSSTQGD